MNFHLSAYKTPNTIKKSEIKLNHNIFHKITG